MQLVALPDIIGGNAAVPLSALNSPNPVGARYLIVTALAGTARLGDSTVTAARGVAAPQNVPVYIPLDGADIGNRYQAQLLFAYVPSGTTLTLSYGV